MECLACGDCCKRMSPLSNPNPCPRLQMNGDIAHCADYENRPAECKRHDYPARVCPIGMDILNVTTSESVQQRAYNVWLDRGGAPL
jgi:hypothetical protein